MKPFVFTLILLLTTPALAQQYRFNRLNGSSIYGQQNQYGGTFYDTSNGSFGYWQQPSYRSYGGYGYRGYVPQYIYPMNWGAIPGYSTNGYFVPGVYGW